MIADNDRRGDHGVQPVGLVRKAVAARSLPEHGRLGAIGAEPHHHRPTIELRHEQVISTSGRCGDRHAFSHFPGLVPVHRAGFRVEGRQSGWLPNDQLSGAARLVDARLAVAHLGGDLDRAPDLLAGVLVERHHERIGLATHQRNQTVSVDQGCARDAPGGHAGVVVRDVVLLPDERPGLHVQAEQPAGRADHIDTIPVHGRCGPWSHRVGEHEHPVGCRPLVGPEQLAGLFVQHHQPLGAIHRA